MATKPPVWSNYWPKGVTADSFSILGRMASDASSYPNLSVASPSSYESFVNSARNIPTSPAAQLSKIFGGPEKYKAAADAYRLAYFTYQNETRPDVLGNQIALQTEIQDQRASAVHSEEKGLPVAKPAGQLDRELRYNTLRKELENQYKALVKLAPAAAYQGRSSDLNAIFNQQAAQLADAGVEHVGDLRIKNGQLINNATGKVVSTSNLNGQVAVDRDTGVQKWGDIFSGVKGGANYGIRAMQDGSVLLFPAWEKTKSPIAQMGMDFLEPIIVPIATIGGTIVGGPIGAGVGNSIGQFLATGEVELEQALQAAAIAYVGGEIADATGSSAGDIGKAVAPAASTATQVAIGEAAIAAGVGAGAAAVTGGDPLTGAVLGAAGSVTSTTYANSVGKSLAPSASASTQTMIGNAAINAGLSGLTAAVTGGDVEKAILGGAVVGAVAVSADQIASTMVGGEENLAAITAKTNLTETQMADLITRSTTNAILAEITGGNFAETFTQGLVAGGLSTSAANFTADKVGQYVKPEATRAIATGVKGMTDVTVRAAMNGQDVGLALEAALPNLAVATATQYTRAKKIEQDPKLSQLPQEQKLLLAQVDTGTLSDAMASGIEPHLLGEVVVRANQANADPQTLLEEAINYWDRFTAFLPEAAKPEFDSTIRILAGIAGGVESLMGTFGAGTETTETIAEVRKDLIGMLSAEALGDRDRQYQIMKDAEGKGTLEQLKAGYEAFMVDPVGASLEALGSTAPIIAAGSAGAAVGPLTALTAIGTTGGMMGVGELKNEIYKEIYNAARERGLSEADAIQMATAASAYDGPLADQQALAAAIGVVTSVGPLAGLEKSLVGEVADLAASRIAGRATLAGLVETLTEAGQAFQQKAATNIGTQRILDPAEQELEMMGEWSEASRAYREFLEANPWAKDTFEGAVAQATYEGLSSTAAGAGMSAGVDVTARAQAIAADQGVEWELLDPISKSDLMVRALIPQDVIDVTAREVGPLLLQGPEGTTTPLAPTLREQDQQAVTDYIAGKADIALAAEVGRLPEYAQDVLYKEQTGKYEAYIDDLSGLTDIATDKIDIIDNNISNLLLGRLNLAESGALTPQSFQDIQTEIDALNIQRDNLVRVRDSLTEQTTSLSAPLRTDITVDPNQVATILNLTPEQAKKYNLVLPPTDVAPDTTLDVTTDPNRTPIGVSPESAPPPAGTGGPTVYPGAVVDPTLVEQELAGIEVEKTPVKAFTPKMPTQDTSGLQFGGAKTDFESVMPGETWLGGRFPTDPFKSTRNLIPQEFPAMQEANAFSALRQASGVESPGPQTLMGLSGRTPSYYSYGTETIPGATLGFFKRGGTVQNKASGGTINMSPLLMAEGSDVPHKGAHAVQGAGGGQDDLIDAKLADGEYVFDAEIVAALGDGSNKEGAKILDKFREEIRKHKRGGSTKSIPPKAKSPLAYLRSVL